MYKLIFSLLSLLFFFVQPLLADTNSTRPLCVDEATQKQLDEIENFNNRSSTKIIAETASFTGSFACDCKENPRKCCLPNSAPECRKCDNDRSRHDPSHCESCCEFFCSDATSPRACTARCIANQCGLDP